MDEKVKKRISPLWFIIPLSIIVLGFLCYVPFWINSAYLKGGDYQTVWSGSELLAFYGALLSALGAIFLGALSIWQNKQIQKSNEAAQARLERINARTNEVSIINKIIEEEENRIRELIDKFSFYANIYDSLSKCSNCNDPQERNDIADKVLWDLLITWGEIDYILATGILINPYKKELKEKNETAFNSLSEFFECYKLDNPEKVLKYDIKGLSAVVAELIVSKDKYLLTANRTIKHILTDNLSLDEILVMVEKNKEKNHGQDEDAE